MGRVRVGFRVIYMVIHAHAHACTRHDRHAAGRLLERCLEAGGLLRGRLVRVRVKG